MIYIIKFINISNKKKIYLLFKWVEQFNFNESPSSLKILEFLSIFYYISLGEFIDELFSVKSDETELLIIFNFNVYIYL